MRIYVDDRTVPTLNVRSDNDWETETVKRWGLSEISPRASGIMPDNSRMIVLRVGEQSDHFIARIAYLAIAGDEDARAICGQLSSINTERKSYV